jgi:autophagy-related protein 9
MSQIIEINKKSKTFDSPNYSNILLISDLDNFFKNIYDYYYNRGYYNILTQTILDNISYLFSIHFLIFNLFIINWKEIIYNCYEKNECNLEILDYKSYEFNNFTFFILYGLLFSYYLLFFWKSCLFIYKMRRMKNLFDLKLRIKQKEMENMKFDEILERLIDLQKTENFCRVKENLTKFDIISRILRKDNFLIGLLTNDLINFNIKFPILGEINFYSNYMLNNIHECILNFAFLKGEVTINPKFFNLRFLQMKLFIFMLFEILFIPSIILYKLIFWLFKNADNIKSNRNITQKIWSSHVQILFKNYNELQHHFENRINSSYMYVEKFVNCFKDRMINIISKFCILISGSFLVLIFIISSIDDRLLTELKFMGKKIVWITVVIGVIISMLRGNDINKNSEEDYIENVDLKEELYKNIVNKLINLPLEFRKKHNFSAIFKNISLHYESGITSMIKEISSILFFPVIWIRLIINVKMIIKFFKFYSKSIDGLGTIYSYSYMDINCFKCLREKDVNITEYSFNDRKFINSFLYYNFNFNTSNLNHVSSVYLLQ